MNSGILSSSRIPNAKISAFGNHEILIQSVEDLVPLLSRFTLTGLRKGYVNLNIQGLSEADNNLYSQKVNIHYKACGCKEGTMVGLVGTLVGGSFFFANSLKFHSMGTIKAALSSIMMVFIFMALGKIFGIKRAKQKLLQVIIEISVKVNSKL